MRTREAYRRYGLRYAIGGLAAALFLVGVLLVLGLPVRPWAWWLVLTVVSWPAFGPLNHLLRERSRPRSPVGGAHAADESPPAHGDFVPPLPDNRVLRRVRSLPVWARLVLVTAFLALLPAIAILLMTGSLARASLVFAVAFVLCLLILVVSAKRGHVHDIA